MQQQENDKNIIKAHISEITFNNGENFPIASNDIVLFVGPNNVGKSQSLKDIYTICSFNQPTIVVSKVKIFKGNGSLLSLLNTVLKSEDHGSYLSFYINGQQIHFDKQRGDSEFISQTNYGIYKDLFVSYLSTNTRLSLCNPAHIINRNEPWMHPIHYAAYDYKYCKWLSQNFCKAFMEELTPNSQYGSTIPLCIGPTIKLDGTYENEIERQTEYANILESYKQVQEQGDGIKSFTGILLYLMLNYYSTYLIDEPESFLHPPQARIMGQIIGQTLKDNQQAFISTHSEEIIKGLLDVCDNRLKIVRITRDKDSNSFSILDNQMIKEAFRDPLIKYSNLMSSIFHKLVVLCESDSDCKLYSVVENYLSQEKGFYSETLFIHCGGKHRMARTAKTLKALNIDIRLIPDMDVFNDEGTVKSIAEVFGINWDEVRKDYNIFSSNLHSPKECICRRNAKEEINHILDRSHNNELNKEEIDQIRNSVKTISKWDEIKKHGKSAIPSGDATNAYARIEDLFQQHHIYPVPVGELEGFVKEVSGHGPDWVNNVFERYPDLSDHIYDQVKQFISNIILAQ